MTCIGPKAKNADFKILISEEPHKIHEEGVLCTVPSRAKIDEPLQARLDGHYRVWNDVDSTLETRRGSVSDRKEKGWKVQGGTEESWHNKGCGTSPQRGCWKTEQCCLGRKAVQSDDTRCESGKIYLEEDEVARSLRKQ